MRRRVIYYRNLSPFAALGFALLALGAFFLTLPILIAAFVVFGILGMYMAWRFTRAIKKAEEEMLKEQEEMQGTASRQGQIVIDITPWDHEPRRSIEDGRQ